MNPAAEATGPDLRRNFDLKDEIRDYWSKRSETFDLAFGHRIPPGPEFAAWQQPVRAFLGDEPLRVLELACGTGEVTRLIHDLGHDVTALDFSEAMLAVARKKHAGKPRLRFLLADAENTMEPDERYDAIVCRHLVWTLTEPQATLGEWFRLLKPGGKLLVFDGDWAKPTAVGRLATFAIRQIDRVIGPDNHYDGALSDRHATIMQNLPFADGLTVETLMPMMKSAGFQTIEHASHQPIAAAQRKTANLRNRLRTFVYRRFIVCAHKPG
ncbi:ubiquinone/menaquinone biosynthesis C-methylase UbiE [Ensifer adhaerens]|uniref:Ubiquinone/menaquinone biosynthesis C-methylase UbiE n=1 Tax=Ensifer adhaerens TaxID=106592 RepID=A0ACC5SX26_ENSAD|nr:class I SAM-dependent methyltransferase [Ensifer adhaerens]MBP1873378.1 ubiquinone/menaquinone biosynthesis C-methylase UbiE [Ensifer adhaerens]